MLKERRSASNISISVSSKTPSSGTGPSGTEEKSARSRSAPPDFRVNPNYDRLLEAFQHYYTSLPITLNAEDSPAVMMDFYKTIKSMPKYLIAPDGHIPNSIVRQFLKPEPVHIEKSEQAMTEATSQRAHLEQLINRYLSDERTRDTLSSITFLKDVALLRVATSTGGVEKIRNELMTSLAIEVEGLLERPCEQVVDEDSLDEDEAARMEKSAELHKAARQFAKQAVQKHFEQKIKQALQKHGGERKLDEEDSFVEEVDMEDKEPSPVKSGLSPTNYRQEEDLIDRIAKDHTQAIQERRRVEVERTLPFDFVKNTLEKLSQEWGGMAQVMEVIFSAVHRNQDALDKLDGFLKSREARVGMINSVVSPTWAMVYLGIMLGTDRLVIKQLDILSDPATTPEIQTGAMAQLINYLGTAPRMEAFLKEFQAARNLLEVALTARGIPKEVAKNLLNEALSGNNDAKNRVGSWLKIEKLDELLNAVRMCNKDKCAMLLNELDAVRRDLQHRRSEEVPDMSALSADASLLAQLDEDAKRVMQYDGIQEVDEDELVQKKSSPRAQVPKRADQIGPVTSELSASVKDSGSVSSVPTSPEKSGPKAKGWKGEHDEDEEEEDYDAEFSSGKFSRGLDEYTRASIRMTVLETDYDDRVMPGRAMHGGLLTRTHQKPRMSEKPRRSTTRLTGLKGAYGQLDETAAREGAMRRRKSSKSRKKEQQEMDEDTSDHEDTHMDTLDGELFMSDEDTDELLKAMENEMGAVVSPGVGVAEESVTEVSGSQPARYPDPAFEHGHVRRFEAHPTDLKHLITFKVIEPYPDTAEALLDATVRTPWFTNKNVARRKEPVAVEVMRGITTIRQQDHLMEAVEALVQLRRQYGLGINCCNYIIKQSEKVFDKYMSLLKKTKKARAEAKSDIFVRALAMLSIATNFGLDVALELEQLENEYTKAMSKRARASLHDDKLSVSSTHSWRKTLGQSGAESKPKRGRKGEKGMVPDTEAGFSSEEEQSEKREQGEEMEQEKAEKLEQEEAEKIIQEQVESELDKAELEEKLKEEELSPEERKRRRAQKREEIEAKVRKKILEQKARDRTSARQRTEQVIRRTSSSGSAIPPARSESGEVQWEGEPGVLGPSRILAKKRMLQEKDTVSSSSHEKSARELEEEITIARHDVKRRKKPRGYEGERKPVTRKSPFRMEKEETVPSSKHIKSGEPAELHLRPPASLVEMKVTKEEEEIVEEAAKIPLIKLPTVPKPIDRSSVTSFLKEFLEKQGHTVDSGLVPSVSLKALAGALQDPRRMAEAERVIDVIQKELGVDESDPILLIKRMRDQMDGIPESKFQPFNKMINLLSVFLAVECEQAAADDTDREKGPPLTFLGQAEASRQRQKLLMAMVDDIVSQLSYEYTMLDDLSPQQRAVWLTLETQADSMKETCEKIGFLVSSKVLTPEFASLVTSLFMMTLLDLEAILRRGHELRESEQQNIYCQSKMMLEVLGWFNIKPKRLIESLEEFSYLMSYEPILECPPTPQVNPQQLEVILPSSYVNMVEEGTLDGFGKVEFIPDDNRVPLEDMYLQRDGRMKSSTTAVRKRVFGCATGTSIEECVQHQKLRWLGHVLHIPDHRSPKRVLFSMPNSEWRKQRDGQLLRMRQRSMKEITKRLGAVGATRLPGWGPRDPHCAWLETPQDMTTNRCQCHAARVDESKKNTWLVMMTGRLSEIHRTFDQHLMQLGPECPLVRLSARLADGLAQLTQEEEAEEDTERSEFDEDGARIMAFETGKIAITSKGFEAANALSLRRKTMPSTHRRQAALEKMSATDETLSPLPPLKSPTLPQVRGRAITGSILEDKQKVLALLPRSVVKSHLKSGQEMQLLYHTGSLALVSADRDAPSSSKPSTPQVPRRPVYKRHKELPVHLARHTSPTVRSPEPKTTQRQSRPLLAQQKTGTISPPNLPWELPVREDAQEPEIATVPPTVTVASSLEVTELDKLELFKPPDKDESGISSFQTKQLDQTAFSVEPSSSSIPVKIIAPWERREELQEEFLATSPEEVVVIKESKKSGVWNWFDNLVQAKTAASKASSVQVDPERKRQQSFIKLKPIKLLRALEAKVTRLQHLVENIQECPTLSIATLHTDSDQTSDVSSTPTESVVDFMLPRRVGENFFSPTIARPHKQEKLGKQRSSVKRLLRHKQADPELSQLAGLSRTRRRLKKSTDLPTITSVEELTANLDTVTRYLKSVMPPGNLTRLLAQLRNEKTSAEAVAELEGALIDAAQKARNSEADAQLDFVRLSSRPSKIPLSQWKVLDIPQKIERGPSDMFQSETQGVHCRYAQLARKGFHKQDLSIAAHLTRMELVNCINKAIQERVSRRSSIRKRINNKTDRHQTVQTRRTGDRTPVLLWCHIFLFSWPHTRTIHINKEKYKNGVLPNFLLNWDDGRKGGSQQTGQSRGSETKTKQGGQL
ncbi:hypothetical protein T265_12614 [Opisthorchis viverrini]|uniref:Uncharacterized protein n=1 Tax=Opisthorchis viverrini TaxID=6198 RepID=A0A075ABZ3_OPIVI|nr:hypothetical protein T265_12614 [Opisthorchis viverrini]KER33390.1 hypothetical protein T265_12614 [Opisthorchis viverrini]